MVCIRGRVFDHELVQVLYLPFITINGQSNFISTKSLTFCKSFLVLLLERSGMSAALSWTQSNFFSEITGKDQKEKTYKLDNVFVWSWWSMTEAKMQNFKESLNLNGNSLCTDDLSPSKKTKQGYNWNKRDGIEGVGLGLDLYNYGIGI